MANHFPGGFLCPLDPASCGARMKRGSKRMGCGSIAMDRDFNSLNTMHVLQVVHPLVKEMVIITVLPMVVKQNIPGTQWPLYLDRKRKNPFNL